MKKILRTGAVILLICLLAYPGAQAFDVVDPSESFYVADYADVILPETERYIVEYNNSLASQTGGQLVVVTVDFLDGADIEEYSTQLFNEWEIGDREKNNGMLVLLAVGEQDYWATQGSGISSAMTSSLLGEYLYDYLEMDFAAAQYDAGVRKLFDALIGWYSRYYNVELTQQETVVSAPEGMETLPPIQEQPDPFVEEERAGAGIIGEIFGMLFFGILCLAIVLALIVMIPRGVYLRRRGYHYTIFNRAFWSARHRPPPPRPYAPPRPGMRFGPWRAPGRPGPTPPPRPSNPPSHGGFGAGSGLGGMRPGGLGGSTRGGGAGRTSSAGRRSGGFSRPRPSSGGRGFGGSTRGGGAGRRGR